MAVKCMSPKSAKITLVIAAIILVASLAVLMIFPTVYRQQLKKDIALSDGSLLTGIWRDIPIPIYEKIYLFNITNGDEFTSNGVPLNVTEVGPYTYKSRWVKRAPFWNSNGTVTYREIRTYHFVPEMSVGSENDSVYTLNGPLIIASDFLKAKNFPFRALASLAFGFAGETVVIKKTVRELTYGGYKDEIIRLAPLITTNLPFKNGVFLWLFDKNATNDGTFTVFTGVDDQSQTGIIDKWNGADKLSYWKGDTCNKINGTSIETGPPLPETPESYTFYQSIFCRSLTFNYTGDRSHYGVNTKHFVSTEKLFANGSDNPENECFDLKKGRASGVLDVRPCQFNAPVLFSFPHFHMADPSYLHSINGLDPNEDEHGSYIDVDPITGLSLDLKVRFQINLDITHTRGIVQLDSVREGIFPVLWVGLELALTDSWADFLKGSLNNPKIIAYSVLGVLLFVCTVLVVSSLVVLYLSRKNEDDDPLLDVKEEHKKNLRKRTLSSAYGASEQERTDFNNPLSKEPQGYENQAANFSSEDLHPIQESKEPPTENDAAVLSVNSPPSKTSDY